MVVTVGTQFPFNRLVKAVDSWAAEHRNVKVCAQVCELGVGSYHPKNIEYHDFMPQSRLAALFGDADLIISHAGMGSIIGALSHATPIIILPRLVELNEHRNNHQVDSARCFSHLPGVTVAENETHLVELLDQFSDNSSAFAGGEISPFADVELTDELRKTIFAD